MSTLPSYPGLLLIHVTCVILSGSGFLLRGWWMLNGSPLLKRRTVRVLPHIVDTLLLGSAIALAVISRQYPLAQNWLTAKVVALVVYVVLGSIALKRGKTLRQRQLAFAGALLAFAYIVLVALTKSALPHAF